MKNFILSTLGIIAGFIVIIIGTYMSMSVYNRGKYASVAETPVDESENTSSVFNAPSGAQPSSITEHPQQAANGTMQSQDQSPTALAPPTQNSEPTTNASSSNLEIINEYNIKGTFDLFTDHVTILKNGSSKTVRVDSSTTAYNSSGEMIAYDNDANVAIGSGSIGVLIDRLQTEEEVYRCETTFRTSDTQFDSITEDISLNFNITPEGVIVQGTNNGNATATYLSAVVIFFKNGNPVYCNEGSLDNGGYDLLPGETGTAQINCTEDFDSVEVYLTGRAG